MRLHCSFRMEKYLALQEERICSEFVLAELLNDKKQCLESTVIAA